MYRPEGSIRNQEDRLRQAVEYKNRNGDFGQIVVVFYETDFGKSESQAQVNPLRKDEERLKAKIFGVNSQIEALAERLAELPKSISSAPIFRQMERLEVVKKENEEQLKI